MVRQTALRLLLSSAFASIFACMPPFFTPPTTGNTNATGPTFFSYANPLGVNCS
jgi:hypothetical protein